MKTIISALMAVILCATGMPAWGIGEPMEVRILTDDGQALPTYPVKNCNKVRKAYAEAFEGENYRINVRNLLNRRIGLVIAVDGRNIISGKKSRLKNNERMYILEPYGSGEFAGWRTARNRINRFYFTDASDSYAAAFGDESAMGVIAVALYPEMRRCRLPMYTSHKARTSPRFEKGKTADSSGKKQRHSAPPEPFEGLTNQNESGRGQVLEHAGTGYGRDEYSPSRIVAFKPENRALQTVYLKYEWRSTLCRLGVVQCGSPSVRPANRFWNNEGYAVPPPLGPRP